MTLTLMFVGQDLDAGQAKWVTLTLIFVGQDLDAGQAEWDDLDLDVCRLGPGCRSG